MECPGLFQHGNHRVSLALVLLACAVGLASAEIHRAKTIQQAKHPARRPSPSPSYQQSQPVSETTSSLAFTNGTSWLERVYSRHGSKTWIYSIASAIVVGLSGIFPLIIIPIDGAEDIKNGGLSNRLIMLLNFAVGGLLGDVFLHLLPEAWAHAKNEEEHIAIGFWVLTGLLAFLIIEKMFPDNQNTNNDSDDDDCGEPNEKNVLQHCGPTSNRDKDVRKGAKSNKVSKACIVKTASNITGALHKECSSSKAKTNGHITTNGDVKMNGDVTTNGHAQPVDDISDAKCSRSHHYTESAIAAKDCHIKTSGWLNLIANMIDNFTHGLAVAGSYSVGTKTGLVTTAAILLHEVPHEIGDFAILLRSGFDRWEAAKAQILTAVGGLVGVLAALFAESAQEAGNRSAWILPFTSGSFIYIALVSVLPDLLHHRSTLLDVVKQLFLLLLGIAVMASVTLLD